MTDQTPVVPKPKAKRKPAKPKKLSKKELAKLEPIEWAARMLTLDERACVHLAMEVSPEHAATVLGWGLAAVNEILKRPNVRLYAEKVDAAFIAEIAKAKVRILKKVNAIPANVEARLMELAMMDPENTRGSIDGQVKALEVLAKTLGMMDKEDPFKGKSLDEIKDYVRAKAAPLIEAKPQ